MNSELQVLVTGSTRGIGRAIVRDLAAQGYAVIVHGRQGGPAAADLAEELVAGGARARALCFDVSDREAARLAIEGDIGQHGAYYGIVCNAGIARDAAFPALTGEDWDLVLRTNLDGFFNVVHPAVMPMVRRRRPGRIVTLASVSGLMGNRGQTNYSAAKAGLMGASKALAVELASRKITVNCVAPGLIDTEMIEPQVLEEALKLIPARRMGKPEEVAALVRFLLSPEAAYITRQVISVNGGMVG